MIAWSAVLGFVLRLGAMRTQGSAWFDEAFSLHFAAKPFPELASLLFQDVHSPLYPSLLRGWMLVFGGSLDAARAFSVLAGVAAVAIVGAAAARMYGREAGALAAFAAAVSPALIFHSAEARMYGLLLFLAAASTERFLAVQSSGGRDGRALAGWAAASAAALLTHLAALPIFLAAVGVGAFRTFRRGTAERGRFLAASAAAFLPFLLWAPILVSERAKRAGGEWLFMDGNASGTVLARLADLFLLWSTGWSRSLFAALLLVLLAGALLELRRTGPLAVEASPVRDDRALFLAASLALPFLAFLPVHMATAKYLFAAFPAAAILAAGGFVRLFGARRALVAAVILAALVLEPILFLLSEKRIRWDEAAAFVEERERPDDVVWHSWFANELPFRREYRGSLPMDGAYPYDPSLSFDERLVRHAGQIKTTESELDRFEETAAGMSRVFFVSTGARPWEQPALRRLFERGWRLSGTHETNAFSPVVLLLERPRE